MDLELITHKSVHAESSRPDLLFVHGAFCSAHVWLDKFIPYFNELGYNCHALSLRAHGKSSHQRPLHLCGLIDYAEDLETALRHVPHNCVVIAHSLSALVLLRFLRVRKLYGAVLMNPMPPSGTLTIVNHMLRTNPALYLALCSVIMTGPTLTSRYQLKALMLSPETDIEEIEKGTAHFQHESLRAIAEAGIMDFPYLPFDSETPSLVIGGDQDHLISVEALEETASYINAEVQIIEGAPHAIMLDSRWKSVAEPISQWINSL